MHWILLAALAVILIGAAYRYPRLAFSLLALIVAAAAGLYYFADDDGQGGVRALDAAAVQLAEVRITPSYAGSFKASGAIRNLSPEFDITEVSIRFELKDCAADASTGSPDACAPVSHVVESVRAHVPPGGEHRFEQSLAPRATRVEGERRWTFEVVDVAGRRPLRIMER